MSDGSSIVLRRAFTQFSFKYSTSSNIIKRLELFIEDFCNVNFKFSYIINFYIFFITIKINNIFIKFSLIFEYNLFSLLKYYYLLIIIFFIKNIMTLNDLLM